MNPAYQQMALNNAARFDVQASWILALIETESGGVNVGVHTRDCYINKTGTYNQDDCAYGLMGIRLSTAKQIEPTITASELMDPAKNIEIGTIYLKRLKDQYGSIEDVFAVYKGGRPWWQASSQARANAMLAMKQEKEWQIKLASTGKYTASEASVIDTKLIGEWGIPVLIAAAAAWLIFK